MAEAPSLIAFRVFFSVLLILSGGCVAVSLGTARVLHIAERVVSTLITVAIVCIVMFTLWNCAPNPAVMTSVTPAAPAVRTSTIAPPAPFASWPAAFDWAFQRSLTWEERYEHANIDRQSVEARLKIRSSTVSDAPSADGGSSSWLLWLVVVLAALAGGGLSRMIWK